MQILTLGADRIKAALSSEFTAMSVDMDEGGIGVTSYVSENELVWTRVIGADGPGQWDVYDPASGASGIVVLEPWEERIVIT